jgi:hypothetical protein
MTESILAKNFFGAKSYYDLNVIAKSEDQKIVIVKSWDGILKKLRFSDKDKCYIVESELM